MPPPPCAVNPTFYALDPTLPAASAGVSNVSFFEKVRGMSYETGRGMSLFAPHPSGLHPPRRHCPRRLQLLVTSLSRCLECESGPLMVLQVDCPRQTTLRAPVVFSECLLLHLPSTQRPQSDILRPQSDMLNPPSNTSRGVCRCV